MEKATFVVLLGDSIFDNSHYVNPGQSVSDHLTRLLPRPMKFKLLAVDGSITSQVLEQLGGMPKVATHVFVSTGGNDALIAKFELFPQSDSKPHNALELLAKFQTAFRKDYSKLLTALKKLSLPVTVCTIYDAIPGLEAIHRTALSVFNDTIVLEATRRKFSVIDLRLLCGEATDYSTVSPIEPSEEGGCKIAKAIVERLRV